MLSTVKDQLREAYHLIKAGEKAEARKLLIPILKQHPHISQAWWLAANAALRDTDAVFACVRVLELKPTYEPARHMLVELKLRQAANSLEQRNKAGALAILKPLVERQRGYVGAWLLLAEASPSDIDAMQAYRQVLHLQKNHALAQRRILELQSRSHLRLSQKIRLYESQVVKPKHSLRVAFSVFGLAVLMITCVGLYAMVTGQSGNLPIGQVFSDTFELGSIGQESTRRSDTLLPGTIHEYNFKARANDDFLMMIAFANSNGERIRQYVTLYGPDRQPITMTKYSALANLLQFDTVLPSTGDYRLVLTGAKGALQGAYVLEMTTLPSLRK